MPAGAVTLRTSLADVVQSLSNLIRGESETRPLPGAATPTTPMAPAGTLPRAQILPYSYNTNSRPRGGTGLNLTAFDQLRNFADFDLLRIAINDGKNQVLGMRWEIRLRQEYKGQEKALGKRIDEIRRFCEHPDPFSGMEWPELCGAMYEEIVVTDALTLLPRMNLGGELIAVELIDGASIIPLVDDRGRPPLPPAPAYQQIVYGASESGLTRRVEGMKEYSASDLLYLPRNRRVDSPYGRSNTEAVLFTANLSIRQQLHDLGWYTEGNVPDGGMFCMKDATPDVLEAAQEKLDAIARGRTDQRAGYMRLMYDGTYVPTKTRQWSYEELEWLGRIISWGFGVSPIPIAKQMNRSTGQTMEQSSTESGVRPVADFIASVMNRLLRVYGGVTECEFAWADDETEDPTVVYERQVALLAVGAVTINQVREEQGDDPYDFETPPMRDTPAGPQLLEKLIEDLKNPPEPPPGLVTNPPPGNGQDGKPPADNPPPSAADDEEPTAQEKAWAAAFSKYRAAVAADVATWKRVCMKRAREGKQPKLAFKSNVIVGRFRRDIASNLGAWTKTAPRTQDVAAVFDGIANAYRLNKGELKPTKARSKVEKAIVALIEGWLQKLEPKVVAWALEQLPAEKIAKADGPDFSAGHLAGDLSEQLAAGGGVGAAEAAVAIGVNLERVPEAVTTYARTRAGELVGKQYVAGQWVDSTSGSAISDTLRKQVQDAVAKSIEESWTPQELASTLKSYFEISRAQTIARTETGFAYGNGAAELYKAEGIEDVKVIDGPGCLPFGHDDGAQKASGDVGSVEADAQADSQVWTVRQYQSALLGHPNCVRVAVPYIADKAA